MLRLKHICGLALVAWTLSGTPVLAQGEEQPRDRKFLLSKVYEAYRKSSWDDVASSLNELEALGGGKLDSRLLYFRARAYYEQGKAKKPVKGKKPGEAFGNAIDALKQLLDEHPDHVEGTYLYAEIEARKGNINEAKNRLVRAAARGRYVLHDLNSPEGTQIFKNFQADPEFILEVMTAANEFEVSNLKTLRNPFASPIRRVSTDGEEEGTGVEVSVGMSDREKKLEEQIERLFKDIDELAKRNDREAMSQRLQELRALMNEYGAEGSEVAKQKLAKWKQTLLQYGDIYLSIQLKIFIQQGNQYLKDMAAAMAPGVEEWDVALERFEDIKALKAQMEAEERDVFRRNAQALFVRGQQLAAQAARMKKIDEFELMITGIIVTPSDKESGALGRSSAIINDTIVYLGDKLIDPETQEPIPDLEVVVIAESTVTFRYQGTKFIRSLRQDPEEAAAAEPKKKKKTK